MQSHDGRYVIVFNGEIYNFLELRDELYRHGARFKSNSDTEVILEGYRRWGVDVVNKLHGMFAFVIWDRFDPGVFGARDRLGIKPLCWAMHRGCLIASSTIEPFLTLTEFRDIDLIAVRDLMAFDYVPTPRAIFRGVKKMEPGSRFQWRPGDLQPRIDRYWSPPLRHGRENGGDGVPDEFELESLLERAVHRQMISDVPLGAFLSGGIDSSLLVAFMARHSSKPVRTFSVAFAEKQIDESPIAKTVAQRFSTEHTVFRAEEVGPELLLKILGRLDEPFCDAATIPTYALSHMTRQHVKVALSGDGGDEVFGGYPKYFIGNRQYSALPFSQLFDRSLRSMTWRPRGVGRIYWRTLSSQDHIRYCWARYGDFPVFRKDIRQLIRPCFHDGAELGEFFHPWERRAERYGSTYDMDVLMRVDLETYLSENCLVKTDRASMLASLEVRVPYLDETVLNRILPLPVETKIHDRQLKALLLPLARRLLPEAVWNRPKHGFNMALHTRLAGAWKPAVETVLDWGESNVRLFNYDYLRRLHAINLSEGGVESELWNPFVFLAWSMAHSIRL
jgi:asparagine synthase (glutamine-hydrolysing)